MRTSRSNIRLLRSGFIGSIRAWLPSRRSTAHQRGAWVMRLSGQVRSGRSTAICSWYGRTCRSACRTSAGDGSWSRLHVLGACGVAGNAELRDEGRPVPTGPRRGGEGGAGLRERYAQSQSMPWPRGRPPRGRRSRMLDSTERGTGGGCRCPGAPWAPTTQSRGRRMTSTARRRSCTILPPYLLERLRRQGDPRAAAAAARTLALDGRVRSRRELRAAGAAATAPARPPRRLRAPGPAGEGAAAPGPHAAAGSAPAPHRAIHDAAHTTTLPGTLVRAEGGAADRRPVRHRRLRRPRRHVAAVLAGLRARLARRSRPAAASRPCTTSVDYDNAFWDGTQMVFGDGDGAYFNRFTDQRRRHRPRADPRRHAVHRRPRPTRASPAR